MPHPERIRVERVGVDFRAGAGRFVAGEGRHGASLDGATGDPTHRSSP